MVAAALIILQLHPPQLVKNILLCLFLVGLLVFIVGLIVYFFFASREDKRRARMKPIPPPAPLGYTNTGQPIYPVVGYTSDGTAITADRVEQLNQDNSRYNTMAILTLISAFSFPILAIPFGLISLSQIGRTRERGAVMAMIGLLIGSGSVIIGILVLVNLARS